MGTQLTLPAGWARQFVSASDTVERLDALRQAPFDIKAAIRAQFDELANRFGIRTREVYRAMVTGMPFLLLHGWPYDIHTYVDVSPHLVAAGHRLIVLYLRGYGATRFLSELMPRNGQ